MAEEIGDETYDMAVVRGFALSALVWGIVGMLVGLVIALQLAWPAADVVSHLSGLDSLPVALEPGRTAMRRIRENLALAVAYNAVAVPLAIAGILGPFSAALAMSASSVVVTANALRLRRFGRPA